MHRSGTSLLGNLLHAAGIALPGPLIPGDQHNPEGYFERADITDLQEQLLIDLDRWWPSATGMLPLPSDWWQRPETQAAFKELHRLLAAESQRQPGPWAIKDPRSSLLLPLWKQVCQELGIPLRLVLAVRDPAEVVSSLCARDADAAGMTAERAELLWWHHNQTVLAEAAGLPLQVVNYSRWFNHGPGPTDQLLQLLEFCNLGNAAADPVVLERCLTQIKPQHRRSHTNAPALRLTSRTRKLHQALTDGELQRARKLASKPPRAIQPDQPEKRHQLKAKLRALLSQVRTPKAIDSPWDPGAWFDEDFYCSQWPGLAACSRSALLHHYRQAGWRTGTAPHPLFDPGYYRQACEQAGVPLVGDPLTHWLATGLGHGLPPGPLCHPLWLQRLAEKGQALDQLRLAHVHPWGAAAEALTLSDRQDPPKAALALLGRWVSVGQLGSDELRAIAALPSNALTNRHPLPTPGEETLWTAAILGGSWHRWQTHALLQHLPLPVTADPICWYEGLPAAGGADEREAASVVLHLQPLEQTNAQGLLLALAQAYVVDADPARVHLLRQLGVNAWVISGADPIRRPLGEDAVARASAALGLPPPQALATQPAVLCLGSTGPLWEHSLDDSCWCLPGFHDLAPTSAAQGQQLAAWLQACQLAGIQLVELGPPSPPLPFDGFAALAQPQPAPAGWLPVQRFCIELTPAELQRELNWRRAGQPPPEPCVTPKPACRSLWEQRRSAPAAAVCVSLHNYADCIETALDSVQAQTLAELELIVVDDASSDHGAEVVLAWLERHGHRFARALLLQHASNGGLASARNTAFAAAEAPWCFVLDADNQLLPAAVERCLAIAKAAPASAAVVHPLVHLHDTTSHPQSLLSKQSWQQSCFRGGNYVDAMALVRRSAWQRVGGYTHIPDGWEDFDFWCKLIDHGMHGVLCPQPLAIYTTHGSSMSVRTTNRNQRPLSRQLQHRHPWLNLPMAQEVNPAPVRDAEFGKAD